MTLRPQSTRRVVLAEKASGLPKPQNFRIDEAPLPPLAEGQVLTRTIACSADPGKLLWSITANPLACSRTRSAVPRTIVPLG